MKVGILGTGFGAYHASIYKNRSEVDSVVIFGRNEKKLRDIKEELNVETTTDIELLLRDPEIDLIDICLPSDLHSKFAVKALLNGKDIFCETPVSLTLADAKEIQKASKASGNRAFVNQFTKFFPEYEYIQNAMQCNTYGQLKGLRLKRETPPIWGNLGLDTITTNLMIHELDFVTWLLGLPEQVTAKGIEPVKGQSHLCAFLDYKDIFVEVTASSMLPNTYPFTAGYEALFEQGKVDFYVQFTDSGDIFSTNEYTAEGQKVLSIERANPYEKAIAHVLQCCLKNEPTRLRIDDAVAALEVALQIKDCVIKG